MSNKKKSIYQVGGSLPVDAPTYVKRKADEEFYQALQEGHFCYVLNSRQMGKSSLQVQTMKRLEQDGIACAEIDITLIGTQNVTPQQWYGGLIRTLTNSFRSWISQDFNLRSWIKEREMISPVQLWAEFIEDVLLKEIPQNIVIFIDEIDSILSVSFKDDFFAAIRAFYNKRTQKPEYQRLTFALLGVATPSDLISDKNRTPFNIGRAIQLNGFKLEEAQPLARGLFGTEEKSQAALEEILYWTGGQPFLTQKICQLLLSYCHENCHTNKCSVKHLVDKLIQTKIIDNWEAQDEPEHLRTIKDRIVRNHQCSGRLLGIYEKIVKQGELVWNDYSRIKMQLRLSGLVFKQGNKLKVYNRIYQSVFNYTWVKKELRKLRPYAEALNAWEISKYEDKSRLLRGKALEEAETWAADKSLSDLDYKFLQKSHEWDRREEKIALVVEKQAKEAEKHAKEVLLQAKKKSNIQIKAATFLMFLSLLGLATAGLFTNSIQQKLDLALGDKNIELSGNAALRLSDYQQIEALKSAILVGEELQKIVKDRRSGETYLVTSPILALQSILDNIQERNQLEHKEIVGQVNSVNISPNGKYIVTASNDSTAQIWDLSGNKLARLKHKEHHGTVYRANFSPDSKYIVTASADKTAKIWDLSGKKLITLPHEHQVNRASFSSDGKRIITVSFDQYTYKGNYTITLWDLFGKKIGSPLKLQGKIKVIDAVFSPKELVIATTSEDGTVQLLNKQGKLIQELKGHEKEVKSIAFNKDGNLIATASSDTTVRLWDWNENQKVLSYKQDNLIQVLREHTSVVNGVTFSHNGDYIATASRDNTVRLWKKDKNQTLYIINKILRGHGKWVYGVAFASDNKHIVTASADTTARVWKLSKNKPNGTIFKRGNSQVFRVAFSPDGNIIATASGDGKVRLWHKNSNLINEWVVEKSELPVYGVAFSPDGKQIATGSRDGKLRLWDIQGKLIQKLDGHKDLILNVAFSPDGKQIATSSGDGTARLWNKNGKIIKILKGHEDWVESVAFSPDGKQIATASRDGTARLWDKNGQPIKILEGHKDWVYSVAFSPDGKQIATASRDRNVLLWDRNGIFIKKMEGYQYIKDIAFSPRGKSIAIAYYDGTVRLWDKQSHYMLQEFVGHDNQIHSVAFSPDGKQIATGSRDGSARLWSVVSIEQLEQLLNSGCDWLKEYFVTHPEELKRLKACHKYSEKKK